MVNPCIGELKRQNENPKIALLKISYGLQNWMKKEKLVLRMTKKKKQTNKKTNTELCLIAQETIFSILSETIMKQNQKKREFKYIHIYA